MRSTLHRRNTHPCALCSTIISLYVVFSPQYATAQTSPSITASLSDFKVDRPNAEFLFTLKVTNPDATEKTVFAIVYGVNDLVSPPRRSAWPMPGCVFSEPGTERGAISASSISRSWQERTDYGKGVKVPLKAGGSDTIEGVLPIESTSPHGAWKGQRINPNAMYNEITLWVFSDSGQLIFEKEYTIQ